MVAQRLGQRDEASVLVAIDPPRVGQQSGLSGSGLIELEQHRDGGRQLGMDEGEFVGSVQRVGVIRVGQVPQPAVEVAV